jgi:predicted transcriptional regulator
VDLDDDVLRRLDAVARRLDVTRSELLRRGVLAVLAADDAATADAALVAGYERAPQDPLLVEAAARLAAETAPEW